ncbi:hypothetical protein CK203_047521 [Vitis vinifera]|uniref:Uncharacterized protein n=1 Tax=Vitis vinifera TaxID=29760 RepID=A0A438GWY7_VITVI|nr:hypothetical protein CK203_047521 [Vitis vinifera]
MSRKNMRLRTHAWRDTWPKQEAPYSNSPSGQSKKLGELTIGTLTLWPHSCLLPIKEAILLPIHVQANPSVAEDSTCNTIEATKRMIKNGRIILQNISEQTLYPKILNKRTNPGASCLFHPDRGAPVQAILHRALSSLSWAFRSPVCAS